MSKKQKTTFGIFTEAAGLYFSNFDKFLKYMTFPVLGQLAGIILILVTSYFYAINMPNLINKYPDLGNFNTLILIVFVITLPGLALFCKAFWEYLIAYGAINSMLDNMLRSGKVYDFGAHTELIQRRGFSFIGLWLLLSLFTIVAICPLMWIICTVLAVYFVLIFQVFTYEPELSPVGCFKKSFLLIKGKFFNTFTLLLLVGLLTYFLIPQIIIKGFDAIGLNIALSKTILPFISLYNEIDLSSIGLGIISHKDIALFIVQIIIAQILVQYTLPLRSILWAMWYKNLNKNNLSQENEQKNKRKRSECPSEKLMKNTKDKYSSKKIDKNILKRALEKDDEE